MKAVVRGRRATLASLLRPRDASWGCTERVRADAKGALARRECTHRGKGPEAALGGATSGHTKAKDRRRPGSTTHSSPHASPAAPAAQGGGAMQWVGRGDAVAAGVILPLQKGERPPSRPVLVSPRPPPLHKRGLYGKPPPSLCTTASGFSPTDHLIVPFDRGVVVGQDRGLTSGVSRSAVPSDRGCARSVGGHEGRTPQTRASDLRQKSPRLQLLGPCRPFLQLWRRFSDSAHMHKRSPSPRFSMRQSIYAAHLDFCTKKRGQNRGTTARSGAIM